MAYAAPSTAAASRSVAEVSGSLPTTISTICVAGLQVTVNGYVGWEGGPVGTIVIEWGDGQSTSSPGPFPATHTYASAGTYTITVSASSSLGSGSASARIVVGGSSSGCSSPPKPYQPAGITSFGDSPSTVGSTTPVPVTTREILGYADFSALSVADELSYPTHVPFSSHDFAFQLETVLQVTSDGTSYLYLVQNVPEVTTTAESFQLATTVWPWGTTAQNPNTTPCSARDQAQFYEMEHLSGQLGRVYTGTGTATCPSAPFYGSGTAAEGTRYSMPLSAVFGTEVVGRQVELFYELPGSAPVVWDTLTLSLPDESVALVASPSLGGLGVGSAAFYVAGAAESSASAVFAAISGRLGLYYLDGQRVVPFSDVVSADAGNTAVGEGTENVVADVGADGYVDVSDGTPTAFSDPHFAPPVPAVAATATPTFTISTVSLPTATVGYPYSTTLAAVSGAPPYRWSVTGGSLPSGLRLDPTTGAVSGTPASVGTASVTVTATDSSSDPRSATATFSISVVRPAATRTTITRLPSSVVSGTEVGYRATVVALAAGSGQPTGSVTFDVGATVLCIASVHGDDARCSSSKAPVGTDTVVAKYAGDRTYAGSRARATLKVERKGRGGKLVAGRFPEGSFAEVDARRDAASVATSGGAEGS